MMMSPLDHHHTMNVHPPPGIGQLPMGIHSPPTRQPPIDVRPPPGYFNPF